MPAASPFTYIDARRDAHSGALSAQVAALPDDPMLHACVIAYASDFNLLSTALLPHGVSWFDKDMVVASIDHALWFHRDTRADEWMLYTMDAPTSQDARGFSRGLIYDRQGRLCVSVTQESLMRRLVGAA